MGETASLIGALVGSLGLLAAGGLLAQAPSPTGATLYQSHCAGCHEAAAGRTPSRSALAERTAGAIAATLRTGVMASFARDLDDTQLAAIGAYLGRKADGPLAAADEAPPCAGPAPAVDLAAPGWNGWGGSPAQARFQPAPGLTTAEVPRLKPKWAMAYAGGRNGQPTVVGGRVYLTAASGAVYSLNAATGCAFWRFQADAATRSTVVVGSLPSGAGPARLAAYFTDATLTAYAIDAQSGALIWRTKVDDQAGAMMTGSPTLAGGRLYVPVSSGEEYFAQSDSYACCRFRGAVAALDAATGTVIWKAHMIAAEARPFRLNAKGVRMYGPAGAAVWSAPTVDTRRGLVYVGTGDSYTEVPLDTADSVMALDARTGTVRWSVQLAKGDNFIMGCEGGRRRANCPDKPGPDHDIGASPILHTVPGSRQLLLVGQKSSQIYALDPDRQGRIVWTRRISPGGPLGGIEFSIAADATTLYAPVSDIFVGAAAKPGLHAFRIADGAPLWSTPSPPLACAWRNVFCHPGLSQAISAMPGAVFAGAMNGRFRAYDSATGKVIWDYDTGDDVATVAGSLARGGVLDAAGPTIAGGMVYVSSGYQGRSGTAGSVLLAFSVDGR